MKNRQTEFYVPHFIFLLGFLLIFTSFISGQTANDQTRELLPNQKLEREMNGAETHRYILDLKAGEFFQARVEQKGADVLLKLLDSSGKELAEMDSPNGTEGFEILTFVAEANANFTLEVSTLDDKTRNGKYIITRAESRPANARDRRRVEIEHIAVEALKLRDSGKDVELSVPKFLEALDGWAELGDTEMTAMIWDQIKQIYKNFTAASLLDEGEEFYVKATDDDWKKAALRFDVASRFYRAEGDKEFEAQALFNLGLVLNKLSETGKSLDAYLRVLPLEREIGNRADEAATLDNIGLNYSVLGEREKAIDYFNQSLAISRAAADREGAAFSQFNLGKVYSGLGEIRRALEFFNQSLAVYRATKNARMETLVLNSIGVAYDRVDEYDKALDMYSQSLEIADDEASVADATVNIGFIFDKLGENQKALDIFNEALPLYRSINDKKDEAGTLIHIGKVYAKLSKHKEAVEFYNQSLAIYKAIGDKKGEATALNNLGAEFAADENLPKALEIYLQSLAIKKSLDDVEGQALTLSNLARTYADLKDYEKARDNFYQSLLLRRVLGDKSGEAETLASLRLFWAIRDNARLAIFYGKQSIGNFQELRQNAREMSGETQKVFLQSIEDRYKKLAETLIVSNRLAEAQQILDLYQDQQFFDFDQDSNQLIKQAVKTAREESFAKLYAQAADKVKETREKLTELKRAVSFRTASAEEARRVEQLEIEAQTAQKEFYALLERAETEFAAAPDEKDKVPTVADLGEIQSALRENGAATGQKAAAIYTLAGKEKFYTILITADEIKSFASAQNISPDELNEKILQFYALLQSPAKDPRPLGKELYDIIFKPLAGELPKDVKTIAWSLDGTLRYVPVAALFDGEKYLVERFQTAIFTRADKQRMTQMVSPSWTGTGFGSSEAHTVDLLGDGDKISFNSLPGVKRELNGIFRTAANKNGILDGKIYTDAGFGKTAFFDALKQKRPLVHISSHFAFRPGDASRSFLLLGDGSALTLREMRDQPNLFAGVELLTLSACNTAATEADANGREVDGFAELAQRLGANAVMASLWQVSDESTALLMSEFYRLKKENPQITKAEAMRTAQTAMIEGKLQSPVKAAGNRSGVFNTGEKKVDAPDYQPDPKRPFAHPYYWSPFVLIGNWR